MGQKRVPQLGTWLVGGPPGTRLLKGTGAQWLGSWAQDQRRVWSPAGRGTSLIPSFLGGDIKRVKSGGTGGRRRDWIVLNIAGVEWLPSSSVS